MKKLTHQQIDKEIESRLKAYGINVKVESGTQKKGHSTNRVFFLNGEKTFVYTYNDATNKQIGNPIIKAPAKNMIATKSIRETVIISKGVPRISKA